MPGRFTRRRIRNTALLASCLLSVGVHVYKTENALGNSAFFTGYTLSAALIFLAFYNVRKKLPAVPISSSRNWLQLHVYVGLGAVAVYYMHTGVRWPDGPLESLLAGLFLATAASGLLGLYWTRTIPPRLARIGEEVIYERIPALRHQLRQRAEQSVLDSLSSTGGTTLEGVYRRHLESFFETPRETSYRLWPSNRRRRVLMARLTEAARFLSPQEKEACEELFALVRKRDDLDYHEALQWRLKAWLFVHIGLTIPLLTAATLHGVAAHAFSGGLP